MRDILASLGQQDGITVSLIAGRIRQSAGIVHSACSRLAKKGLVRKTGSPIMVFLTEEGKKTAECISASVQRPRRQSLERSVALGEVPEFPVFPIDEGVPEETQAFIARCRALYTEQLCAVALLLEADESEGTFYETLVLEEGVEIAFNLDKLADALTEFPGIVLETPRIDIGAISADPLVPIEVVTGLVRVQRAFPVLHAAIRTLERKKAALDVAKTFVPKVSTEHLEALKEFKRRLVRPGMVEKGVLLTASETRGVKGE